MNNIKLIVGLANPGKEYEKTRHNAGAWYVNLLAERYNQNLKVKSKFFGYSERLNVCGKNIHLLIPTTFMNSSGKSVSAIKTFYCISPKEILVAHDELNLPPGVARFKLGGSHGGHNGLKNIISKLDNDQNFYRLRIGIGQPRNRNQMKSFVLGKPTCLEQKLIRDAVDEAVQCTEIWMEANLLKAMNRLHRYKSNDLLL